MPHYQYTQINRNTHPPYRMHVVESVDAYNLAPCEEIHVTVPPADDIRNDSAWSYPHITFVDDRGQRSHIYIGWGRNRSHIPVDSRGRRLQLDAGCWTLFNHIVGDMTAMYDYI